MDKIPQALLVWEESYKIELTERTAYNILLAKIQIGNLGNKVASLKQREINDETLIKILLADTPQVDVIKASYIKNLSGGY